MDWSGALTLLAGLALGAAAGLLYSQIRTPAIKVNVSCVLTTEEMKRLAVHHANEFIGDARPAELEVFGWIVARKIMQSSYPSEVWIDDRRISLAPGGAQIAEEYSP